jgi:4-amino-4-deoxychorismate lyase
MLWIDGTPCESAAPLDRGLEFGDGLFETLAVVEGRPRLLSRHLDRLTRDAARLRLSVPPRERLEAEIRAAASRPGTGVVKVILTRGVGGSGYTADPAQPPRRYVLAAPARRAAPTAGARTALLPTALSVHGPLVGIKHLNRLEQVLLRQDVVALGLDEGLVGDGLGHVVCGTMTNVFLVAEGVVITPALTRCGIEGVMRGAILDHLIERGTPATVRDVTTAELAAAEEVFLTNALLGVWPVAQVDGRPLAQGRLGSQLRSVVATW